MTLPLYVSRLVGIRILAALAVLMGIMQILDLLEVTTDIIERHMGMGGIAYYALLRTPRLFQQAAPLAVLAGCLFAFSQLAQQSAVAAMRAAGMSAYRLAMIATPVPILVVILQLLMGGWLAPQTDQVLNNWWRATTPVAEQKAPKPRAFRMGRDIVVATPADDAGRILNDVHIYRRDQVGRMIQSTSAERATFGPEGWTLHNPQFETPGEVDVERSSATQMLWTNRLLPADVQALGSNNQVITHASLERAAEGGGASRAKGYYRTQLQRAWAAPFATLIMMLIASPVALSSFRSGGAQMLTTCLGAGLLFLVVDGVFTAVGESGLAPAFIAAWAAPLIFGAGAITALLKLEG